MKINILKHLFFVIFMFIPCLVFAETAYVTDNLMVGLHQENTPDSPIIKLIPTGTALEVLGRENDFIQVREPEGNTGWIDNRYLAETPPATNLVYNLRKKISALETELEKARSGQGVQSTDNSVQQNIAGEQLARIKELRSQNAELEQKYKSERLTVGELQAKLAELRNQLTKYADQQFMSEKLEQLTEANTALEQQIDNLNRQSPAAGTNFITYNWKKIALYLAICFIAGLLIGVYLLDLHHRRRHGGFRI